jgi:hypothetical protein
MTKHENFDFHATGENIYVNRIGFKTATRGEAAGESEEDV